MTFIPLTTFANYLGRIVTIEFECRDGVIRSHSGMLTEVSSGTVYINDLPFEQDRIRNVR
jgi:hypothetical protein